ncbi:hypothetical protein AXX17_ATUG04820, partial [Arabidopsis thaliana]
MTQNQLSSAHSKSLSGKVALVTGAASGIGLASARRLAAEGAKVALLGRGGDELSQAAQQIIAEGGDAIALEADISVEADMKRAYADLLDRWGQLDIVVANAGVNGVLLPIEKMGLDDWEQTIGINLTGTFLTVKHAIEPLKRQGGSIIITSSINGNRVFSNIGFSAYSSSKAGQVAFTKMAALELARYGIRVNAICPGAIDTNIEQNTDRRPELEEVDIPVEYPEGDQPLRHKAGSARQVANVVKFLASEESDHVTAKEELSNMSNNKCLAMLLAGGEGKRLNPLTGKWAKPAVPFGGKHRIIDFPISNCLNSGIDNIGILTQYKADSIHSYVRKGQLWNTKGKRQEGFTLLPSDRVGESGYTGTADAIYQNIDYIDSHAPEHVLILSGDHIYQMDYRPLLAYHEAKGAAATIVVKHVPWEEASRFGLMSTGEEDRITDFAEKPAEPKSNLASLGIYVFRWSDLRKRLMEDAADATSTHDFGKDIIPTLLADEEPIYAYAYEGYWRDVGTIDSLWESNMDLLDGHLSFNHNEWPMNASPKSAILSSTLSAFANIKHSLLQQGVVAKGEVNRSVVSFGCQI